MLTNQQQLELAENPNTNAETLLELKANSKESSVLAAIASNPNSPPDLLVELATDYLEDIGQNPALDLILLEDPGVAQRMFDRFYWRYKKSYLPKISPILLRLWSKSLDEITRRWVAGYKHAPSDIFVTLYKNRSWKVREKISKNPATPAFILRKIICKDKDVKNKKAALVNLLLLERIWSGQFFFEDIVCLYMMILNLAIWSIIYFFSIQATVDFKIFGIILGITGFFALIYIGFFERGNSVKELIEDLIRDYQQRSSQNRFERIETTISMINEISFLLTMVFNLIAMPFFPIFFL